MTLAERLVDRLQDNLPWSTIRRVPWSIIILIVLLLAPFLSSSSYILFVFSAAMFYAMVVMALNVIVGANVWHLAHATFIALGGYTAGYLTKTLGLSLWITIPAGVAVATIASLILFLPTLRLHEHYLMIATLIIGVIGQITFTNMVEFTGGTTGMAGIHAIEIPWLVNGADGLTAAIVPATHPRQIYYIILLGTVFTYLVVRRLDNSPLGIAIRAMREDDLAARAMGHDTRKLRLIAVGIGSALAGLAGGIFVARFHAISPAASSSDTSILYMTMLIVGGSGNIYGAITGGALLAVLPQVLQDFEEYRLLVYGTILLVMMLYRPQGIFPERARQLKVPKRYKSEDGSPIPQSQEEIKVV